MHPNKKTWKRRAIRRCKNKFKRHLLLLYPGGPAIWFYRIAGVCLVVGLAIFFLGPKNKTGPKETIKMQTPAEKKVFVKC